MPHFLNMAWFSHLQFHVKHYVCVSLVTHRNSDGVDQIVAPKSSGFHELLIKELHVTPLSGHLGV